MHEYYVVSEGKASKKIPESLRFDFWVNVFVKSFSLSKAKDKTSGPLDGGVVADLPLSRKILAIRQKSREPIFMEVIASFELLA